MRYINKQKHATSCGPVAVMNAAKWRGIEMNYERDLHWFRDRGFNKDGTNILNLCKMLQGLLIPYSIVVQGTIKDIDTALDNGKSIILAFHTKDYEGHYVFIESRIGNKYKVYNYRRNPKGRTTAHRRIIGRRIATSHRWGEYMGTVWIIGD